MPLFYRTTAPFVTPVKEILLTINMSAKPTRARTATDWLEMREAVEQVLQTPVLEPKANMDTHAGNREVIRDAEGTPHSRQALQCVTCRGSENTDS